MHREQGCCDERRIPREPTSWLSRQLDQMLRGLVYASGVAGDLGDDRVRHPSVVAVILNNKSRFIKQLDWTTARGPRRTPTIVVRVDPFLHVNRVAYVQRAVGATDDIDEEQNG